MSDVVMTGDIKNLTKHVRVDDHFARLRQYIDDVLSSGSKNTYLAYTGDIKRFIKFCMREGFTPFTSDDAQNQMAVRRFIDALLPHSGHDLIYTRYKPTTISRTLFIVGSIFRIMQLKNPLDDVLLKRTISGRLKRVANRAPKQAAIWPQESIVKLSSYQPRSLKELRDLCITNVALDTLCRASELARIKHSDIDFENRVVSITETKTQKDRPELRLLSRTSIDLIRELVERYGFKRLSYLFVPIHRNGHAFKRKVRKKHPDGVNYYFIEKPLGYHAILDGIRNIARITGANAELISAHSMRVSGAVIQRENGASFQDIMKAGGWRSPAMVLRYTEGVDVKTSGAAVLFDALNR